MFYAIQMPSKALKTSQIEAGGTDARALHGGFSRATVRLQMPGRATINAARLHGQLPQHECQIL